MLLFAIKPADKASTDGGKSMKEQLVLWQKAHIVPTVIRSSIQRKKLR